MRPGHREQHDDGSGARSMSPFSSPGKTGRHVRPADDAGTFRTGMRTRRVAQDANADIRGLLDLLGDPDGCQAFGINLPATPVLPGGLFPAAAADTAPLLTGHGELILLVDDEQTILTVEQAGLESNGYEVIAVNEGVQALADYALHRNRVAAVVIDLMMPVMDGFVVMEIIRRMSRYVPIIATSGLYSSTILDHASRVGMTSFLAKPHTVEALLERLGEELLLARRCPAS